LRAGVVLHNAGMLPSYVLLDLETTGGNPVADRITEIAAVRVEEGREVARWSTLVNPGTRIPAFIESLTGIRNAMVEDAPAFEVVAPRLLELLDGAVLVAHNARFDHGFLKNAFERMQIDLRVRTLCTVRLSRRLYPQHRSHGLDALIQRHGLQTPARHRAMGDVDMVLAWLEKARQELGDDTLRRAAAELLQGSASLPPHLETALSDIPQGPGVYLFFGDTSQPLYVGKSVQLRARVLSHFQADHTAGREMRLSQETRRVEVRRTAGELGALLLEARLVKQLQPVHNRRLRRESALCAWRLSDDPDAWPLVELVQGDGLDPHALGAFHGAFRSRRQATGWLSALADAQGLCPRVLGLEAGRGRCFASQLGRCQGPCWGQEPLEKHRLRVALALAAHRLQAWPFAGRIGLREHDAATGRTDIHVFDHWCHLATVQDPAELQEALQARSMLAFDLDTYRLLQHHLTRTGSGAAELIRFG
jgi:DNA polymerase-3 subunit epsilon